MLSQKLFDEVTKDVKVTDAEVQEYYAQNQQSYSTPESRKVRHILVSEKKGDEVDFPAEQDRGRPALRRARERRRLRGAREGGVRRHGVG